MDVRFLAFTAALIACAPSAWATASLPTNETYSVAADLSSNILSPGPTYVPLLDISTTPGATAQIAASGYAASASTTLGSNHVYAQADAFTSPVLGAGSFSGWYDQVTINGGNGAGIANFTVQLDGTANVGEIAGGLAYVLGASSIHPSLLVSSTSSFNTLSTPWPIDALTPISSHTLGASPYNDTSLLFGAATYDQIMTPGSAQSINVTLHGTLNFTYGESFYLVGGLGATLFDPQMLALNCTGNCPPSVDGAGATTLDFSNSAHLVNISLPAGATASFASGEAYNVTSVPEPGEWLMLLAGLGLVGWRARRYA